LVVLRANRTFRFYIYLVKQLLRAEFEEVTVHGVGERNIFVALKVTEILTRHGYAELTRLKTKSAIGR